MSDNFDFHPSHKLGDYVYPQPDSLHSEVWAEEAKQTPGNSNFPLSHKLGDYVHPQPDSVYSDIWAEAEKQTARHSYLHPSQKLGDYAYPQPDSLHSDVCPQEVLRIPKKLLTTSLSDPPQETKPYTSAPPQEAKLCALDSMPRDPYIRQTTPRFGTTCDDGLREHRRYIYEHVKQQWDLGESLVTFTGGALSADKLLSKMPRTTAVERLARDQRIAGATTSALAAGAIEYTADRIVFPQDQKMEGTIIADWFVGTGIALTGLSFKSKLASMLAVHAIGRCVDHFRQPKQDF